MHTITNATKFSCGSTFSNFLFSRRQSDRATPASFEQLFGDLSNSVFSGDLNLGDLNLNSLKGCPKKIEDGYFSIENNPELKTLDYFPEDLDTGNTIFVDSSLLELFLKLDISTYKDSYFYLTGGGTLPNKDLAIYLSRIREARGDFEFIHEGSLPRHSETCSDIEKLYKLYEKVGFDRTKFDRALELL